VTAPDVHRQAEAVPRSRLRIVFFGTPSFAVPTLAALLDSRHEVVVVVTQPDRPRGRGQLVSHAPVKALALERGIPVLQPERLRREDVAHLVAPFGAELGVVAAYGKILPEWLLQTPPLGMINVHASLLPKYRGAAPVHRAILAGETETGVTIMRVVKALDAGPMLATVSRAVRDDESSDVVERDLAMIGARLLVDVVDRLASGPLPEVPQDDSRATYAPRLTKQEGLIDWQRPAQMLHNQVRGLRPWPAAYTFLNGARVVVHRAGVSAHAAQGVVPGACVAADARAITIACGEATALDVLQLQPEGKRIMTARDFAAGHPGLRGQRFG
jgi:methionyl-tRNA formyltransferase